jgi:sulfite reductase alpha subunit-like flavoprotein/pSer/pThr/pTyr-binding forkhead associated (FHA) protein
MALPDQSVTVIWRPGPAVRLVVQAGPQAGQSFALTPGQLMVGRGQDMDIVLQDGMASRRHARIDWQGNQPGIEDLGSSNGTFVNNVQISGRQPLKPGDRILMGQTVLLVQPDGVPSDKATDQPPEPAERTQLAVKPRQVRDVIPARLILTTAARTNQRLGHENLGFLSESHGIMPAVPPLLSLPAGYEAWDRTAADLPELYRTLRVRAALEAMPVLSAAETDLPDRYLLRASCLMSMLAHAYYRIEAGTPDRPMPEGIQRPWEEISRRLNRPAPHLSYIDLIMYNWRLVDPDRPDPMRVNNLRLLVPTVDNKEERIFYLTQVEILAQSTRIINALVQAQEAATRDDVTALKQALGLVADDLRHVTYRSFMTINPNPYSDSYVDPVVWAKTVAPFAVPIQSGTAGPSGTSAPIFHMLDSFFGRQRYDTRFGAEMLHLRGWYPKHWQDFIEALAEISVADYVEGRGDRALKGIYQEATQAYAGDGGFLARHRLKVYGYLDIAFKVGRSVTITGFTGLFKDRTWDKVDAELADAKRERAAGFPQVSHQADIKRVDTLNTDEVRWAKRIVLDVSGTGLRYRPGARCAILPENSDDLVDRTLIALKAKGYESVPLTAEWRQVVHMRQGYAGVTALPLRTLLKFGHIRPLDRSVAKALYGASLNGTLRRIIEARAEDQWELWDVLDMLSQAGFDTRRLWKAHPGEREYICRIVPPEAFRMYSISSRMDSDSIDGASELHLTVGRLLYDTGQTEVSQAGHRHGTASHFLGDRQAIPPEEMRTVALQLVHPPRFHLPDDPSIPIVMFAGGTGIAPFRGFIQERATQANAGQSWLFLAMRSQSELYYQDELEQAAAQGRLQARLAFSRDGFDARFVSDDHGGHFVFEPGEKRHIGDEMLREENARALWHLLQSKEDGGQGAYFYVCGRAGFARSVLDAVKEVIRRHAPGTGEEKEKTVNQVLYRLVGEERYMQDVFTTYTGSHLDQKQAYDASEIVLHNDEANGYWMVLNGRVYDLTEFAHIHAGGFKIIYGYAGMDATQAYQKVQHHINPEVDAMLGMVEIGVVRRLDFGMEWGMAIGPDGLHFISLADVYRAWIRLLYNVVEMENALHNDFTLQEQALTRDETPDSYSPLKLQFILEAHDRFLVNYVEGTMGLQLDSLWAVTSGACAHNQDVRRLRKAVDAIRGSQEAATVARLSTELAARIRAIADRDLDDHDPAVQLARDYCALLEAEDKRFLREVKMTLRAGIRVFEEHEHETIRQGGPQLLEIAQQMPKILETYYARVLSRALSTLLAYSHPSQSDGSIAQSPEALE